MKYKCVCLKLTGLSQLLGWSLFYCVEKGVALMNFSVSDHMICLAFAVREGRTGYPQVGVLAK